MAFNPFTSFRRHQKTIFAVMAIVCMLLFVLSSGVGGTDLLQQFTDWFSRGSGGRANAAASIDGKNIGQDVVANITQQRKLADIYIQIIVEQAHQQILSNIRRQADQMNPELKNLIDQYSMIDAYKNQFGPQFMLANLPKVQQQLRTIKVTLSFGNAANKEDQTRLVDSLSMLIDRQRGRLEKMLLQGRESYFGGNTDKIEDTLDFMLWLKQADRLGVHLTKGNVENAVSAEVMGQTLSTDVIKSVFHVLREKFHGFNVAMLETALMNEFRVRAAKSALYGEGGLTKSGPPTIGTPEEMFEWYKDVRTMLKVGLIELPVSNFVSQVTEKPTEAELTELYNKYRNEEYDPRFERPGFKEARKVKVDWIALSTDSKFYQSLADKSELFAALSQFGAPAVTADGSAAFALSAILTARQTMPNLVYDDLYQQYLQYVPSWTSPMALGLRGGVHDSSVLRAENLATLVGASAGAALTGAGVFSGPLAFDGRIVANETKDRALFGASTILSAAMAPAPLGIDAIVGQLIPAPISEANVRSILAARHRERMLPSLVAADRDWFIKELEKRSKEQDKVNVEAFINDFVHTRGLQRGSNNEAMDRFALADAPGLAELRVAYDMTRKDPTGEFFVARLMDQSTQPKLELFQPVDVQSGTTRYIHWRTEDREPRAIPFDQAKPKVEAAWKLEKARPIAKAAAEKLAADVKNKSEMELRDLAAKASPRGLIELPAMAKLNSTPSYGTGGSSAYTVATIPPEKVRYGATLVAPIIELRKEKDGATAVAADVPKANFYVAALMKKDVPTLDQFRTAYRTSMVTPSLRDTLFDYFDYEEMVDYHKELTKQLRSDAKLEIFKNEKRSEEEGS